VLETTGGLVLEALRPVTLLTTVWSAPSSLRRGDTVTIDPAPGSNWVTVAVSGGIVVPGVLGSSSADSLAGIVPFPITDGVEIPIGAGPDHDVVLSDLVVAPPRGGRIAVTPGPRVDWFVDGSFDRLLMAEWAVTASGRVGVRLAGPRLERVVHRELPSEGLIAGAVQVPPDGQPIVMGPDHPVTGGYPVIAVVAATDLAAVLDRSTGSRIRFVPL
jgi:allophanate hydrolase subunit 2